MGQEAVSYRWPFGGVGVILPFNIPLKLPVLQFMGALYMGNRPTLHVDHRVQIHFDITKETRFKVSLVMEQFLKLLLHCGAPPTDFDFANGRGSIINQILVEGKARSTLFTGSSHIAEKLARDLNGRVNLSDSMDITLSFRSFWKTVDLDGRFWDRTCRIWNMWLRFVTLTLMEVQDNDAARSPLFLCMKIGLERVSKKNSKKKHRNVNWTI